MSDARTKRLNESQNPAINGGIADEEHKIIIPKNTTAALADILPQEASIAYDTTLQQVVVNDGTGFVAVGAAMPITGDANTLAYFDNSGNIADNTAATFNAASNSLALFGLAAGGAVTSTGIGSIATGFSTGASSIISASAEGTIAHGRTSAAGRMDAQVVGSRVAGQAHDQGNIIAEQIATEALGRSFGNGSLIEAGGASGHGARASGNVSNGSAIKAIAAGAFASGLGDNTGQLIASGVGSQALGTADGVASNLTSQATGSSTHGTTTAGGQILADVDGAVARGVSSGSQSLIYADANGAEASGEASGAAQLAAYGSGAKALGKVSDHAIMQAADSGALALGHADGAGSRVDSAARGAIASGFANSSFVIRAQGTGALAQGQTDTGSVIADGKTSMARGDDINVASNLGTGLGLGHRVGVYEAFVIGQYSVPLTGSQTTWVATEPAFVIGNGSAIGVTSNALKVDKDGKLTTTGAQVGAIRLTAISATLSARTDHKLVLNDTDVMHTNTITLPAGVNGLSFKVIATAANLAAWSYVPDGIETVDANVPNPGLGSLSSLTFLSGVWYGC